LGCTAPASLVIRDSVMRYDWVAAVGRPGPERRGAPIRMKLVAAVGHKVASTR